MNENRPLPIISASNCEGFVLAGGTSTRMGMHKCELVYRDQSFLDLAIAVFREIGIPVSIVIAAEQQFHRLDVPVLTDRIHEAGPLGGIHAALCSSAAEWCFFLPCDVPLIDRKLLELLYSKTPGSDIVVPVDSTGHLHPLCAGYAKRCLPTIENRLHQGCRKVRELLDLEELRVKRVPVAAHGISDRVLANINTLDEYQRLCMDFEETTGS